LALTQSQTLIQNQTKTAHSPLRASTPVTSCEHQNFSQPPSQIKPLSPIQPGRPKPQYPHLSVAVF